jgi:hypothetical protein
MPYSKDFPLKRKNHGFLAEKDITDFVALKRGGL